VGHADADVVSAGLPERTSGELIAGEGLDFVGEGDGVFAFGVFGEFAVDQVVEGDVDGDVIAVRKIEGEVEELGGGGGEFKAEPIFGGGLFPGIDEGDIRGFVTGGEDGLTKAKGSGVGPGVIGFGFELGVGGERPENSADGNVGRVGDIEGETGTGTDVSEQVPVASVEQL